MTSPTTDERTPSTSPRALLVGVAGLMLALGLLQSLIGVRGTIEQYTDTTLGLVMSAYFVGFLVGSIAAPRLVHRAGHVRSFAALASPAAAMFLLHGALVHPLAWLGLRAAAGFCIAGLLALPVSGRRAWSAAGRHAG